MRMKTNRAFWNLILILIVGIHTPVISFAEKNGETALHLAARNGNREVIEALLAKGADVNVKDKRRFTPLKLANKLGNTEIADLLQKYGAKR